MLVGSLTLKEFCGRYPDNVRDLRERLELSQSRWNALLNGETTTMERGLRIFVLTGGLVDPNSLAGCYRPEVQQEALRVRSTLTPLLDLPKAG